MEMPFGKHKGMDLRDIPLDYLKWCEENITSMKPDLREEINFEISRRSGDTPGAGKVVKKGK